MASLDEKVKLRFLQWQDLYNKEKPFEIVTETFQGSGNRRTNLTFGTHGEQGVTEAEKKTNLRSTTMVLRIDSNHVLLMTSITSRESSRNICHGPSRSLGKK